MWLILLTRGDQGAGHPVPVHCHACRKRNWPIIRRRRRWWPWRRRRLPRRPRRPPCPTGRTRFIRRTRRTNRRTTTTKIAPLRNNSRRIRRSSEAASITSSIWPCTGIPTTTTWNNLLVIFPVAIVNPTTSCIISPSAGSMSFSSITMGITNSCDNVAQGARGCV